MLAPREHVSWGYTSIARTDWNTVEQIIPLRRHASAREIARSVLFLASAQSSFTTGATLMVDGGMSA